MTPLRQRMIEDMCIRNFASTTQRSYIHYVAEFAKYFNRSPQELDLEAVRQYQLYLTQERKLSPESVNTFVSAVQFLYLVTLEMPWDKHDFPRARLDHKLPVVLAPDEIQRFLEHVSGVKNRAVLLACYGSGLRISEAVALKPSDIDSKRKLIRVRHGKGGKDRYTILSPCLLELLRAYYRILRPAGEWLFPSWRPLRHLTAGAVQSASRDAWQQSGLAKRVTPHTLRHASAYYTTFPTSFILKTIGLGRGKFAAVYGPRGPLSPVAVRPAMTSPSGRLSTEHTLPHASPVEYVPG